MGNDEELASPNEISADEVHVEIEGLPEWFASALSHPHVSFPYATGIPLTRNTRVEAECNDADFEVDLNDDFKLRIQNTLYWGSDGLEAHGNLPGTEPEQLNKGCWPNFVLSEMRWP